jgi:hypothetical protein
LQPSEKGAVSKVLASWASDVGLLDVDHYLPGVLVFVAVLVAVAVSGGDGAFVLLSLPRLSMNMVLALVLNGA